MQKHNKSNCANAGIDIPGHATAHSQAGTASRRKFHPGHGTGILFHGWPYSRRLLSIPGVTGKMTDS
jgi:hypothetical protein